MPSNHLQVEDIVILGHVALAAAIRALVDDRENNHTFIDNWIYIVEDAKFEAPTAILIMKKAALSANKAAIGISLAQPRNLSFCKRKTCRRKTPPARLVLFNRNRGARNVENPLEICEKVWINSIKRFVILNALPYDRLKV